MKYIKFLFLLMFAASLCTSCTEEIEEVLYTGYVIHADTRAPFANLEVSVTDGQHINKIEHTDAAGFFSVLVRFNEINSNYYLLIGDISCKQVKREFKGFGQATVDLGTIEVEGPQAPTVTTSNVTSITATSAVSGGNVTDEGRSEVTARGVCWSKSEYPTIKDAHTTNGKGAGSFQSQLTNLETGVKYYVRAYATNKIGTTYGNQVSFETTTGMPSVTTDSITQIKSSSAVCYGTVKSNGGYKLSAQGVCWSTTSSTPTINDTKTTEVAGNGTFSSLMINLTANTKYYVRAYATNANGTSYGECRMFTSSNGIPIVETLDPGEKITENSIVAVGNVIDDEGSSVTARGFVYSTLPYPTLENGSKIASGSGKGYFSSTITGITPTKNTYYIRAYATNENGTGYGDQVTITPERSEYLSLKTMTYGGYTYKIKPIGGMAWQEGYDACENMVYGGYDDWFMPNDGEVQAIITDVYKKWGQEQQMYGSTSSKTPNVKDFAIEGYHQIWASNKDGSYTYYFFIYYWNTYNDSLYYRYWKRESYNDLNIIRLVFAVRKYRNEDK